MALFCPIFVPASISYLSVARTKQKAFRDVTGKRTCYHLPRLQLQNTVQHGLPNFDRRAGTEFEETTLDFAGIDQFMQILQLIGCELRCWCGLNETVFFGLNKAARSTSKKIPLLL